MLEMALDPPNRPAPRRSQSGDSFSEMPAPDREQVLTVLHQVLKGQDKLHGELREHKQQTRERFDEHERMIQQLQQVSLEHRGLSVTIGSVGVKVDNLMGLVMRNQQEDVVTARALGEIQAKLAREAVAAGSDSGAEAGAQAGNRTGRKWTMLSMVFAAIIPLIAAEVRSCAEPKVVDQNGRPLPAVR